MERFAMSLTGKTNVTDALSTTWTKKKCAWVNETKDVNRLGNTFNQRGSRTSRNGSGSDTGNGTEFGFGGSSSDE
jgi:hypothetical protein